MQMPTIEAIVAQMPLLCSSLPTTGPTTSVLRTSNLPMFAFSIAATACLELASSPKPCSWFCVCGNRTMISCRDGSPYCCTTFSPGNVSMAVRTAASVTGCANRRTTIVPPVKSMPRGMPFRASASPRPPMMTTDESTSACHRHRMKS